MDWDYCGEDNAVRDTQMGGVEVEMPPGGIRNNTKRTPVEAEDTSNDTDLTGLVSPMPVKNLTNRFGGGNMNKNDRSNIRGGSESSDETSGGSSGGGSTENNTKWSGGPL